MTKFRLRATKGDLVLSFDGVLGPDSESFVVEALSAMREGLEANGFDVEVTATYSKELVI